MSKVLDIQDLSLAFNINNKSVKAVNNVSLYVDKGEIVALVGESGCGKSLTALATVNLRSSNSKITNGKIIINNEDVFSYSQSVWNKKRGKDFSIIFQEPMTALDPLVKIGKQLKEAILIHSDLTISKEEINKKIIKMLESVELRNPKLIFNSYPHQLSGGMRQRVLIALSLINNPSLLIADEPTTALDVTVQKQVLNILKEMNILKGLSILFISHDLGVVKDFCTRIYVMYAGMIVESGNVNDIIDNPQHPYTKGLINSIPSLKNKGSVLSTIKGRVPTLEKRDNFGCPFSARCSLSKPICYAKRPEKQEKGNRTLYCHFVSIEKKKDLNNGK